MKISLLALALILAPYLSSPVRAQDAANAPSDDSDDVPTCESPNTASYYIPADKRGLGVPFLSVCLDPSADRPSGEEIQRALGCPKQPLDVKIFQSNGMNGFEAACEIKLPRRGLRFSGTIDVQAIRSLLKGTASERYIRIEALLPDSAGAGCEPKPEGDDKTGNFFECRYSFGEERTAPAKIQFSFGYDRAQLGRMAGILSFLLLLPIAMTLWLRRRALSAPEQEREGIWFAYFRFLRLTTLGGALVWWTAIDLLRVDEFVSYLISASDTGVLSVLPWLVVWIPPLLAYGVCLVLSSPIHRLRGTERTTREAIGQAFWGIGRFFIPVTLVMLAISEMFNSPRIAVLLFAAMFVMARVAARKLAKAYKTDLYAITSGELRDRAFALAEKAKAKLYQLYVIPTEHIRMANAFAHVGHNIFLTDYLLRNLNKREVDAVIGHEVAHLQKRHIRTRIAILVFGYLVLVGVGVFWGKPLVSDNFPSGPLFLACLLLLLFFVTRRNEYAADAGAAKLTGDAEAMVTGLAKLSRLNMMPMQWGKVEEKLLTHPSMVRRIMRLARTAEIAEERIPELLSESTTAPAETYAIPSTSLPEGKMFSTRLKTALASRMSWSILLGGAVTPTVVAWIVQRFEVGGTRLWLAYGAGLILTIAVIVALANFLPMQGLGRLKRLLHEKSEKGGAPLTITGGLFVGLAPDAEPRIYENNWTWDAGFLALSPERLYYWGEEARFAIRREEIVRVWAGPGPVGWIKTAGAYISWLDHRDSSVRTLSFRALEADSLSEMARRSRLLARDLENWKGGSPVTADAIVRTNSTDASVLEKLGPPGFGSVTSLAPGEVGRGRFLVRELFVNTFLAVGFGVLAGLRFPVIDWLVSSPDAAGGNATGGGVLYVLAVVWAARVFLLTPFWRSRGHRTEVAPAAVSRISSPVE